ncbi:MAG: DUF6516 family protein [Rhodospirillaceae bacterium]|nr:DUF6516 family protein [Rhodospirillaceae bacterium]
MDHGLEYLLAFDGRIHRFEKGYWVKFEIRRTEGTAQRPHGIAYSFTLHAPGGKRLLGFDNAHAPPQSGGPGKRRPRADDHWHRDAADRGRPYRFVDAATLLDDFQRAVERRLKELGVGGDVIATGEKET